VPLGSRKRRAAPARDALVRRTLGGAIARRQRLRRRRRARSRLAGDLRSLVAAERMKLTTMPSFTRRYPTVSSSRNGVRALERAPDAHAGRTRDPRIGRGRSTLLATGFRESRARRDRRTGSHLPRIDRRSPHRPTDDGPHGPTLSSRGREDLFHVYDLVETRAGRGTSDRRGDEHRLWVGESWVSAGAPANPFAMHAASRLAVAPSDPNVAYAKRPGADHRGAGFAAMLDVDDVESRQHVMCTNVFHQDPSSIRRTVDRVRHHRRGDLEAPARPRGDERGRRDALSLEWTPLGAGRTASRRVHLSMASTRPTPAGTTCWREPERRESSRAPIAGYPGARPPWPSRPATASALRDVRDIRFAGARAYAATDAASSSGRGPGQRLQRRRSPGPHRAHLPRGDGNAARLRGGRGGSPPEP